MDSNRFFSLSEAARALVEIDHAGALADLGDEIGAARREWKRDQEARTVGEKIYVDQLAKILTANGIEGADAWNAVREAIRPSWPAVMLTTIIDFAARMEPARRRA
jgi:hypothetical protein